MVIAGVTIESKKEKKLKAIGVKDSKKLSSARREELAQVIERMASNLVVLRVQPCKIDSYRAKGINLDKIEAMKIAQIIDMSGADLVYVDSLEQNVKRFKDLIMSFLRRKDVTLIVENYLDEKIPVVSAASIIAKTERDAAIEEIKRKVNFDFGSIPYKEKILIENANGERKLIEIGKLVEENQNKNCTNYIFGVNPENLKIEKFEITNYIKHPEKRIFTLFLDHGKKINLSLDHPLLVLNEDGNLEKKEVKDLKEGDFVAAPLCLPSQSLEYLNLAKILLNLSTKTQPIYLEGEVARNIVRANHIKKILKVFGYSRTAIYHWLKKGYVPLHLFRHLDRNFLKDENLKNAMLRSIKPTQLPAIFRLDRNFAWLLGLYVAKGYVHSPYHIAISATNQKIIKRIEKIGKELGIKITKYPGSLVFNSILLVKLIKALKIGENAYTKQIPNFIFSSKKEIVEEFLRGYFAGDGYLRKGNLRAWETRSRRLAEQLQWLLLLTGNYSSCRKDRKRNRYEIYELSKGKASSSVDNIPSVIGKLLKAVRKEKNISLSKLSQISKVRLEVIRRIENQKPKVITKKVLGKLIEGLRKMGCDTQKLERIINSDLCWLRVKKIEDSKRVEPVYDLEVKPHGKRIENFICEGILVHNSGYPHDPLTIEFVKTLIKETRGKLPPYVRKSWITTQVLQEETWQKKLKDFIFGRKEKCEEE